MDDAPRSHNASMIFSSSFVNRGGLICNIVTMYAANLTIYVVILQVVWSGLGKRITAHRACPQQFLNFVARPDRRKKFRRGSSSVGWFQVAVPPHITLELSALFPESFLSFSIQFAQFNGTVAL